MLLLVQAGALGRPHEEREVTLSDGGRVPVHRVCEHAAYRVQVRRRISGGVRGRCQNGRRSESDVPESLQKKIPGLIFNSGQNCRAAHDTDTRASELQGRHDAGSRWRSEANIGTTSTTAIYYTPLPVITSQVSSLSAMQTTSASDVAPPAKPVSKLIDADNFLS